MNNMDEGPKPIILTQEMRSSKEVKIETSKDPGRDNSVLGLALVIGSAFMFSTLDEFCCMLGLLSFVGGLVLIFNGLMKTKNWRKENDTQERTITQIIFIIIFILFDFLLLWFLLD